MSGIAITFPSSPTEGQTHLAQNGFTYIYDSQKNRWKRGGEFVRAPKVLSYAGVAVTTTGSGITTGPTGALIYNVPGFVVPNSEVGVDSYKAYRASDSYPNYTEVQVSISSAFSSVAYAATFTGTTHTIPGQTLVGDTTYYLRARQFVGSDAASAGVGAISGYSQNVVSFATTSTYIDTPVIVSISGSTDFPVYQVGFAQTTLPATVEYTGSGVGNLDRVDWRVTGPRIPTSTGDTAVAEIGIGTHSSATLANALVLAMPFSGATGVGITDDVNNAIRTASGASSGTTKAVTVAGTASTVSIAGLAVTSHFYDSAAYFDGDGDYLTTNLTLDSTFASSDYTIEWWMNSNNDTSEKGIFGVTGNQYGISARQYGSSLSRYITATFGTGLAANIINYNLPHKKTWIHVAMVRSGSSGNLYVNGSLVGSCTASTSFTSSSLYIGTYYNSGTASYGYDGYMQDFKVYSGLAKYTENFTPPLPTYGTISYTTGTTNTGINTTTYYQSTGDVGIAETSSTAADALVLAMPMNKTFGFQDINVAIRGLTSGASAGTAKTVGLGTTSTANAPTHPIISATESKWYDGAGYFDGGDYLEISSSNDFVIGTGNFTIEGWFNPNASQNVNSRLFGQKINDDLNWDCYINGTSGTNAINMHGGNTSLGMAFPSANNWHHFAICRSGSTLYSFMNGVLKKTQTYTNSVGVNDFPFRISEIGPSGGSGYRYSGYIQDFKIYKGFAKYTANFTPPQPICGFSTDISTQTGFTTTTATGALLSSVVGLGSTSTLAFDADTTYAGITSITSSSGITTLPDPYAQNLVLALPLADITGVGNSFTNDRNTQIRSVSLVGGGSTKTVTNSGVSTVAMGSTSKWYGNTASFSSVGTGISYSDSDDFDFGSGDFTLECWVYTTSTSGNSDIIGQRNPTYSPFLIFRLGTAYRYYASSNNASWDIFNSTAMGSVVLNTWEHLAVSKKDSIYFFFKNGILQSSSVNTTSLYNSSGDLNIGSSYQGYIQDVKIYKGVAKYTTNFTPPPPMFGDYTRSTPNKIIFTPASDYVLEAKNTSGIITSSYSATRQWGTKPEGGIYDPYAGNLVLAIPGGAQGGITTAFDVTGQIKLETPTSTYSSGQTVTSPSGSTYTNKSITLNGNVSTSSTQSKYYGRSLFFDGLATSYVEVTGSLFGGGPWTFECWLRMDDDSEPFFSVNTDSCTVSISPTQLQTDGNGIARLLYTGQNFDVSVDTWFHFALVNDGVNPPIPYVNGVGPISGPDRGTAANAVPSGTLRLGYARSVYPDKYNGYMQDVRYYDFAKYTSDFTPPNQIYLA